MNASSSTIEKKFLLQKIGTAVKNSIQDAPRKKTAEIVSKTLLETFRQLGLSKDTTLPPNSELAEYVGISHLTLRKALTSLEKKKILRQQQGKGTYLLKNFSDASEAVISGTVAVLLPYLRNQYQDILDGAGRILTETGVKICVSCVEWSAEATFEERMKPILETDDLIGVIRSPAIYPASLLEEINFFQAFEEEVAPVVFVDRPLNIKGISSVGFDDITAMYEMFSRVWKAGFRDIYFVYPDISTFNMRNAERAEGFKKAAKKYNYTYESKFLSTQTDAPKSYMENMLKFALSQNRDNAAFICSGEGVGCDVQKMLSEININGRRTMVTGFDRIEGVNTWGQTYPSTVRSRLDLGKTAGKLLLESICNRNRGIRLYKNLLLKPEFVGKE